MKRVSLMVAALAVMGCMALDAKAGWFRGRSTSTTRIRVRVVHDRGRGYCCPVPAPTQAPALRSPAGAPGGPIAPPAIPQGAPGAKVSAADLEPVDALDLVNRLRVARGLKPFIRDDTLTAGAFSCVKARARARRPGHSANDFAFLPPGAIAHASGCEYQPCTDWGACCTFDSYTFAGAAYVDAGGGMYCQIFVR